MDSVSTYENPVLFADYSDPDAIRVGDTWYLTASSFANAPGLPVLSSKNLVDWTLLGHALPRLNPADHFAAPRRGGGVWAPAIRHAKGLFTITYPDPDFGIFQVSAADPAGPWSEPVRIDAERGAIDPCPFTDDDGSSWLAKAWARSRSGKCNIVTLQALDASGRTKDPGETIIDGDALPPAETSRGRLPWITVEGPKLYKKDGWYYIFAPAGGVKPGWQGVFRSRRLQGPWEARNVMDQGGTDINGPHQGALVDAPDGRWWFLHFQDLDAWGRVVHLQPVAWKDGWPVIGRPAGEGRGEPVRTHPLPLGGKAAPRAASVPAGLGGAGPSLEWQWQANPRPSWILPNPGGALRLACASQPAAPWDNAAVLARKIEGPSCSLSVRVALSALAEGSEAGLAAIGQLSRVLTVQRRDGRFRLRCADWSAADGLVSERFVDEVPASLRLRLGFVPSAKGEGAERTVLAAASAAWSLDGVEWKIISPDLEMLPGRWVGVQTGVFACAPAGTPSYTATSPGWADFDEAVWTRG